MTQLVHTPEGQIDNLAYYGSKLIKTPLNTPLNQRWNNLVNAFIDSGNEYGLKELSKQLNYSKTNHPKRNQ